MTRIVASRKDRDYLLIITGHATGSVEVCAWVSALAHALILYILNNLGKISELQELREESSCVDIRLTGDIAEAFDMAMMGFLAVEESMPEHVSVKFL